MIRWLEHTADVRLEITCGRYEDLFPEFVTGFRDLLVTGEVTSKSAIPISLEEPGPEGLIVSLGREILLHFNTDRFVPASFDVLAADMTRLRGRLLGEPFAPDRMEFHLEVKGVTYNDLKVHRGTGQWQVGVTFDV